MSATPLCNIQTNPFRSASSFTGKIIFHPDTGITTEEQLLCTAATFAFVCGFSFTCLCCYLNFARIISENMLDET